MTLQSTLFDLIIFSSFPFYRSYPLHSILLPLSKQMSNNINTDILRFVFFPNLFVFDRMTVYRDMEISLPTQATQYSSTLSSLNWNN